MQSNSLFKDGFCNGCTQLRPLTEDHIIPQAIGGILTVLLCIECHKNIHRVDTELTKSLHMFATLLDVKRERGENRPFRVKQSRTEQEFDINSHGGCRAHPEVNIIFDQNGHPIPDVRARSKKELENILDGFRKKHGQLSESMKTTSESSFLGQVEYDHTIGGRSAFRSIAKTAYLFLASRFPIDKISSVVFSTVRDFIFNDKGDSLVSFNFINTRFMNDSVRPVHSIAIHFDTQKRNIVGYVQYFGTYRFSVLLARSFPWEIAIPDLQYCLNPLLGKEVPLKSLFILSDVTIEECLAPRQTTHFVYSEIEKGFKKLDSHCKSISNTTVEFPDT
jgi:hypothetical protein